MGAAPGPGAAQGAPDRGARARTRPPIGRNVVLVGAAAGLFALGESLWFRFAPLYLQALGASVLVVGLWGSLHDLLDAAWQYPAGRVADRLGTRRAMWALTLAALAGLLLFLVPSWPVVLLGLVLYMSWSAYSQPVTFALIGDALPKDRRAMGFVVQSVLRRVPQIVGLVGVGALLVDRHGVLDGVRIALAAAVILALLAFALQALFYREASPAAAAFPHPGFGKLPADLRRLLLSDILVRAGESATRVFIVLYLVQHLGWSPQAFAFGSALLVATSLLAYVPAARSADERGRKPWIALTFLAFTLYPIAILFAKSAALFAIAFVIGGLREIGEPARKASIVDMTPPGSRGRLVGTYYALRGFAIMPVALVSGALYAWRPEAPFLAGAMVSLPGLILYVATVKSE